MVDGADEGVEVGCALAVAGDAAVEGAAVRPDRDLDRPAIGGYNRLLRSAEAIEAQAVGIVSVVGHVVESAGLVSDNETSMLEAGMFAGRPTISVARSFFTRVWSRRVRNSSFGRIGHAPPALLIRLSIRSQ